MGATARESDHSDGLSSPISVGFPIAGIKFLTRRDLREERLLWLTV